MFSVCIDDSGSEANIPIFRIHIHFLSLDISSECVKFGLSMKNITKFHSD